MRHDVPNRRSILINHFNIIPVIFLSIFLNFACLSVALAACEGVDGVQKTECEALVAFYNSSGGANWNDNTGWLEGSPCIDSWYGVECANSVATLDLSSNNLVGTIAPELQNLTWLATLNLSNNQLVGTLPEFGTTVLANLWLQNNGLEGDIPDSLRNNENLKAGQLNITYNRLMATSTDLIDFLNEATTEWETTQTIPPSNVQITILSATEIKLSWTPIPYVEDGGYYQAKCGTQPNGPYPLSATTASKLISEVNIDGLSEGTYYCVVETFTPKHGRQLNDLTSAPSPAVSVQMSSQQTVPVTNILSPTMNLSVDFGNTNGQGSVDIDGDLCQDTEPPDTQCHRTYATGNIATLTPLPASNSEFIGWGGHAKCAGQGKIEIYMIKNMHCMAFFKLRELSLQIEKTGDGEGGVFSTPSGIDCGKGCKADFLVNTVVDLVAIPEADSLFNRWEGDTDCEDGTVTMDKAKECIAVFKKRQTLPPAIPMMQKTVLSIPTFITLPINLIRSIPPNDIVLLSQQTMQINNTELCDTTNNCFQLKIEKQGGGTGDVNATTEAIFCGSGDEQCIGPHHYVDPTDPTDNHTVNLYPLPGANSQPSVSWGGSCAAHNICPSGNCITFNVKEPGGNIRPSDPPCTVTFTPNAYTLNITSPNGGKVISDDGGIECDSDCQEDYSPNEQVELTATPTPSATDMPASATSVNWGGDCSGSGNPLSIIMDSNKTCTATFVQAPLMHTLTINNVGTGTVTAPGINCEADCTEDYTDGTVVNLTATPDVAATFAGWSGDADCSDGVVTMDTDVNCTATFTPAGLTLTIHKDGTGTGVVTATDIDCDPDCTESYPVGTVVNLNATPDADSTFDGWSGDADCSDGTVTMSTNLSCTATFTLKAICYPNLPAPELAPAGIENYQANGQAWTRYKLKVLNSAAFPDALFAAAPDLPPCGNNTNAARTWVDIYKGSGERIYGFCALSEADDLNQIWFAVPKGQQPPPSVYITLNDRRCDIQYPSNKIAVKPSFPLAGVDKTTSLGGFSLRLTPEMGEKMGIGNCPDAEACLIHSPLLFDSNTQIGRSGPHWDDDVLDLTGALIGGTMNHVKDGDFSVVPNTLFHEGPPNTEEVHTQILSFHMKHHPKCTANLSANAIRGGLAAPGHPASIGEVESLAGVGFPAESFFNVFVEVDLDLDLDNVIDMTVYNKKPLVVQNDKLGKFPPHVVYKHGGNLYAPLVYDVVTDKPIGWITVAGHGIGFDCLKESIDKFTTTYDNLDEKKDLEVLPDLKCKETSCPLNVYKKGEGSGAIRSLKPDKGILCGLDCTETYQKGTQVILTAEPAPGSVFTQWSEDCKGNEGVMALTVNDRVDCVATFELTNTFPCPEKPTIRSVNNGQWTSPQTWMPQRIPNSSDVVLVRKHTLEVDQVPAIVGMLCNYGLLKSQKHASLEIRAPKGIKNVGTIRGEDGEVDPTLMRYGYGHAGKDVILKAGLEIERKDKTGGFWWSSVEKVGPIDNQGSILGGHGQYGLSKGGKGGDVIVLGRNVTNDGKIAAGRGGYSTHQGGQGGLAQVFGRLGGTSIIFTPPKILPQIPILPIEIPVFIPKPFPPGPPPVIELIDTKLAISNRRANIPATSLPTTNIGALTTLPISTVGFSQASGSLVSRGSVLAGDGQLFNGNGGNLWLVAYPNVYLGPGETNVGFCAGCPSSGVSQHNAGQGAPYLGQDGKVWLEPGAIEVAAGTEIKGGDITFFGGNDWTLTLSDQATIEASGDVTLAFGENSLIDLSQNTAPVLQAAGQVNIFADEVLTEPQMTLDRLMVAGEGIVHEPGRILRNVVLSGTTQLAGQPGETLSVYLTLANNGPVDDIYVLNRSDAAGWLMDPLPPAYEIAGLDVASLRFDVALPATSGAENTILVTAQSLTDPDVSTAIEIRIVVIQSATDVAVGGFPAVPVDATSAGIPPCPITGSIDYLCSNQGQTMIGTLLEPGANVSGGQLDGDIESAGIVSSVMLLPGASLTGGEVTGYVTNQGTIAHVRFVGAELVGGTLAGYITNASQVGGVLRDVHLAAEAYVSGGHMQGNITGDATAPALLEDLIIEANSVLAHVILGKGVRLAEDITLGEGVVRSTD